MAEGRTAFKIEEDGWYVEPTWVTTFLLTRERFKGRILDPCCGQGNIVRTCREAGLDAVGSDIVQRSGAGWFVGEHDFREIGYWEPNVITNPPYGGGGLTEWLIRRVLDWPYVEKLAVFVPSKFLFSARRSTDLFAELPPSRTWPIYPRPSCPPGKFLMEGGKASGGVENYAWMVWDRKASGSAIRWAAP